MRKKIILFQKTNSVNETKNIGYFLGKKISLIENKRVIVLLEGEMGVGKTSFTKGLVKSLGIKEIVSSPTFILMKSYFIQKMNKKLHHIDVYRFFLTEENLYELLEETGKNDILIIESYKNLEKIFYFFDFIVKINYVNKNQRKIFIEMNKKKVF